jgi:hypothetical protein
MRSQSPIFKFFCPACTTPHHRSRFREGFRIPALQRNIWTACCVTPPWRRITTSTTHRGASTSYQRHSTQATCQTPLLDQRVVSKTTCGGRYPPRLEGSSCPSSAIPSCRRLTNQRPPHFCRASVLRGLWHVAAQTHPTVATSAVSIAACRCSLVLAVEHMKKKTGVPDMSHVMAHPCRRVYVASVPSRRCRSRAVPLTRLVLSFLVERRMWDGLRCGSIPVRHFPHLQDPNTWRWLAKGRVALGN